MNNGEKPFRLRFVLLIPILLLVLLGCKTQDQHILWKELDAPGGKLRIDYDEPPAFGSHTLYFSYRIDGASEGAPDGASESQDLGQHELNNDGANLGDQNFEILDRSSDRMTIVLHGQQQEDKRLVLSVKDGIAELIGD